MAELRTTCPYCGTGCGVVVTPDSQNGIAHLRGDEHHPANLGRLCGKGLALPETLAMDGRLTQPQVHGQPVAWPQALAQVARGFQETIARFGPEAVAFYVSGQLLTEDYYLANKLIKGYLGSANIDSNSRLCMASAVAGYKRAFGADLVPCSYRDLELADLVVIAGSNTAWCHPVLFQRILDARRRDPRKRLVVIDPRLTATAREADLHLAIQGGSDLTLWLGLLTWLFQNNRLDRTFLRQRVVMEPHALELASAYAPDVDTVARGTGLPSRQVRDFFQLFAANQATVTLFSQGIHQSSQGSDQVNAIVNVHLATGRLGQPGMGPFSVTGQPNAMGGREVGALANQLACHLGFEEPEHRRMLGEFWGTDRLPARPGRMAVEMFQDMAAGRIRAIWIMGTNPLVSLPDVQQARRALARCPLVVVSEAVQQTDTSRLAHILLPAQPWGEKDGMVTNSERCISRQRRFLAPRGQAWPDWRIIQEVARHMGFGQAFDFQGPAAIFREYAALSGYRNQGCRAFDISALADLQDDAYETFCPQTWPIPRQGVVPVPGATFFTAHGKACMPELAPRPAAVSSQHPLRLNTGRVRDHWHTLTRTGVSPRLGQHTREPELEIHPNDAHGVTDGGLVRIHNASGAALARAVVTETQRPGHLFMPMHWNDQFSREGLVNALVPSHRDPLSGQPASKAAAVTILPVISHWRGFLLSRQRPRITDAAVWWSRQAMQDGLWCCHLEGLAPLADDWQDQTSRWMDENPDLEWIDFADRGRRVYRRACLQDGMLIACLFIDQDHLSPEALTSFFATPLKDHQRRHILAGRTRLADRARVICACMGVSEQAIRQAVVNGLTPSVEAIGRTLQAGTRCGSCQPEIRGILARCA